MDYTYGYIDLPDFSEPCVYMGPAECMREEDVLRGKGHKSNYHSPRKKNSPRVQSVEEIEEELRRKYCGVGRRGSKRGSKSDEIEELRRKLEETERERDDLEMELDHLKWQRDHLELEQSQLRTKVRNAFVRGDVHRLRDV